jgi:putative lipase involved disintegration of autophagic bodies
VIGTKYGIMLRRFNEPKQETKLQQKMAKASYESKILTDYDVKMPFTVDRIGKTVLDNSCNNHPITGNWNPLTRQWEFEEGLGYRNTGLKLPLSCSGIKFQTDSKGLGYIGKNTRRSGSPIRFVKPAAKLEEGEVE